MQVILVAAMSTNGVMGRGNAIPWHIPEDLQWFKKITWGKPIVMGRKTFESIQSKPLPGRHNIILTRQMDFQADHCQVVHSVETALKAADSSEEVMIIGGAELYRQFLPIAHRLYLSIVHQVYEGDVYFPSLDWSEWVIVSAEARREFTIQVIEKR